MDELQGISFEIISYAGDAKSLAYEALAAAKAQHAEEYEAKINAADETINQAHKCQYQLLSKEAGQELDAVFSILLVHAQDHLMTTMSTIDLIKEISELYLQHICIKG